MSDDIYFVGGIHIRSEAAKMIKALKRVINTISKRRNLKKIPIRVLIEGDGQPITDEDMKILTLRSDSLDLEMFAFQKEVLDFLSSKRVSFEGLESPFNPFDLYRSGKGRKQDIERMIALNEYIQYEHAFDYEKNIENNNKKILELRKKSSPNNKEAEELEYLLKLRKFYLNSLDRRGRLDHKLIERKRKEVEKAFFDCDKNLIARREMKWAKIIVRKKPDIVITGGAHLAGLEFFTKKLNPKIKCKIIEGERIFDYHLRIHKDLSRLDLKQARISERFNEKGEREARRWGEKTRGFRVRRWVGEKKRKFFGK